MVTTAPDRNRPAPLHPLHAVLLAGTVPLFLGVLLGDWTYSASYEIQWKNFASWLLVGGLAFCGFALLWALVDAFRARWRVRPLVYLLLLLAAWIFGFIDSLVHAKDAWASMPDALILSVVTALFAIAATWLGFSTLRAGEAK